MSNRVYAKAVKLRVPDRCDEDVHATLQMVAPLMAVLSRIMTKPNGRLVRAEYVVRNENGLTTLRANFGEFCAESPEGAERIRLRFLVRGGAIYTPLSVNINLLTGSIDIFGKYGTVADLNDWIHVSISDFNVVRAK
jgi:hypothetical protein|nr:MAG TPA: hypothetical protein [Caudoviricetes sp.]